MPINPQDRSDEQVPKKQQGADEDQSIAHDTDKRNSYPRPDLPDTQQDHQPEFIENNPNRKEEEKGK